MKNIIQKCCDLVRFQRARDDEVGCSNAFADGQPVDDPRVVLALHFEAKPSVNIEFHILKPNLCHFMHMMRPERTSGANYKYHEMEESGLLDISRLRRHLVKPNSPVDGAFNTILIVPSSLLSFTSLRRTGLLPFAANSINISLSFALMAISCPPGPVLVESRGPNLPRATHSPSPFGSTELIMSI